MKQLEGLKIKIFADGADKAGMLEMNAKPWIKGLTTNPTLMRKSGITDYRAFALDVLRDIREKPISFEVFSDEIDEMERQAQEIAGWGKNVYVKIPITNTRGESCVGLAKRLAQKNIHLNLTALMTPAQVKETVTALAGGPDAIVSVFAGRVADSGRDPIPLMKECLAHLRPHKNIELLWASPREILNVIQADEIGCHIITVTNDLLKKVDTLGKDLTEYSLETVKMFYDDATKAGFRLE